MAGGRSEEAEAGRLQPGGRRRALDPRPSREDRPRGSVRAPAARSEQPPSSPDQAALGRGPLPDLPRRPGALGGPWGVPFCGSPADGVLTNTASGRGIQRVNVLQLKRINRVCARPLEREAPGDPGPSEKPPPGWGRRG